MLHRIDGSASAGVGRAIALRLARSGFFALAMAVLVMPSHRETLQARQNPLDCKDAQDEAKAGAQAAADDKAIDDFLEIYRLAEGQDLKRIEPPRPTGAEVWWKRKFGKNAGSGTEGYGAMVFRYRDPDQLSATMSSPATATFRNSSSGWADSSAGQS